MGLNLIHRSDMFLLTNFNYLKYLLLRFFPALDTSVPSIFQIQVKIELPPINVPPVKGNFLVQQPFNLAICS